MLQAALLLRMARWIGEAPFAPSYWTFTFGAVALPTAAMKTELASPSGAIATLAPVLFVAANLLVLAVAGRLLSAPAPAPRAGS